MAPKANNKSGTSRKKAAAKKAATKVRKKATTVRKKPTTGKTAKKAAAEKKAAGTRSTAKPKKKAVKSSSQPKRGRGKRTTTTTSKKAASTEETTLAIEDLEAVDDLIQEAPPTGKSQAKPGPRTPSVPRAVKPPPKSAKIEMDDEVLEFVEAVDTYRQEHCRPFPTWTEIFFILKQLGYAKSGR